jgi:transcriptional regulatory protein LevR
MKRLEILLNSNQIDKETFLFLEKLNKKVKKWDKNDKQRFLTHTAIAITRIKKKEKVDSLDPLVVKQIIGNPEYEKGCALLKNFFKDLNLKIPENEKKYLLMHVLKYVN